MTAKAPVAIVSVEMQNLRDKLLKAGKVSKKDKRKADQIARQRRKTRKGHVESSEAQARRAAVYARTLAEQQAHNEAQDRARAEARALHEQRLRVRHIGDFYGVNPKPGRVVWYFMARDRKIHHLEIQDDTAWRLSHGELAIVERPGIAGDEVTTFSVVPREAAKLIWSIDDAYVRCNNAIAEPRWWEGDFPHSPGGPPQADDAR